MLIPFITLTACASEPAADTEQPGKKFDIQVPSFPDRQFVITDYGALADGISLNTEAIRSAIEACAAEGGGRVIIPEGVWVTGPIRLMSNVDLHVEEGAVVLFSRDFDHYPYVDSYFEGRRDFRAMPPIFGDSIENVAITGKGVFDGSGDAWRPVKKMKTTEDQWKALVRSGGTVDSSGKVWWPNEYAYEVSRDPDRFREILTTLQDPDKYKAFYRPPLVQLIGCDRVLLDGPSFQNSPGWCIHPLMCENLTVNDIVVKNPWFAQNGDGIDVESCSKVSIRNSHFDVGDDAICIKSGKDKEGRQRGIPTQFVEVDNCVVYHGHGGFVVGSEMSGGVKDIWVSNCSFLGTDVGLRFKSTRGRGGVVENIHIENIRMINIATDAIIFNLFYAGLAPTEMGEDPIENLMINAPEVTEETPEFRNITIDRIHCHGANRALQIMGLPEMPVSGLVIENSVFTSTGGINCLFASDITVRGVTVMTDGQPTVNLVNVKGANLNSVTGNNEVLCRVEGYATEGITIGSDDVKTAAGKVRVGKGALETEVSYEEL